MLIIGDFIVIILYLCTVYLEQIHIPPITFWFLPPLFLTARGFELGASCLLGRYCTLEPLHQPSFSLFSNSV
jgi:hypothetical protein